MLFLETGPKTGSFIKFFTLTYKYAKETNP